MQAANIVERKSTEPTVNPFGAAAPRATGAAAGADQQRAIAEVQAALVIARTNPRDPVGAMDRILNSCTRPTLAAVAVYSFSRGGSEISGPSVRLAEAIAQQWGNIQFGFRELSRGVDAKGVGFSEVEAFAWDVESNTKRPTQFQVRHWRDTKAGGYALKDERDIYELVANQAQRRVRACILAVIPGDVIETAVQQCETTLRSTADTSPEAMAKVLEAFESFGVTKEAIEKRIQRRFDTIQPAHVVGLRKIFASLRDGMSRPDEWFEMGDAPSPEPKVTSVADIKAKAAAKAKPAALTYAHYEEKLRTTADPAVREILLDEARTALPADQAAELAAQFKD